MQNSIEISLDRNNDHYYFPTILLHEGNQKNVLCGLHSQIVIVCQIKLKILIAYWKKIYPGVSTFVIVMISITKIIVEMQVEDGSFCKLN